MVTSRKVSLHGCLQFLYITGRIYGVVFARCEELSGELTQRKCNAGHPIKLCALLKGPKVGHPSSALVVAVPSVLTSTDGGMTIGDWVVGCGVEIFSPKQSSKFLPES